MNKLGIKYIEYANNRFAKLKRKFDVEKSLVTERILRLRNEVIKYDCRPDEYVKLAEATIKEELAIKYEKYNRALLGLM